MRKSSLVFLSLLALIVVNGDIVSAFAPRPTPPQNTNTSSSTASTSTTTQKPEDKTSSKDSSCCGLTGKEGATSSNTVSAKDLKTYMESFKKDLVDSEGKTWDGAKLDKTEYLAIYYSAHWCPPCRKFTPELVKFYNEIKPKHANFELVFVSSDQSEEDQLAYMKEVKMPWPALKFDKIDSKHPLQAHEGDGIPHLVFLDSTGKTLCSSVENGKYVGPYKVVEDMRKTLK